MNERNLHIEYWPVEKLRPYERNPRRNDHAVKKMIRSIEEYGFKIPLLVRGGGEIVDGHLRLKAARKLGLAELPVILCDEWSEAQVKAFRLLVNRSVSWASWDEEKLALEFAELQELHFDPALTGFDPREIDGMLAAGREEDTVPEPARVAVTRPGELWLCGAHRVLCGDSTSGADVERALNGSRPLLMVTDPPYGVEYDPLWRGRAGLGEPRQSGCVANDDRVDWSAAWELFGGDVAYVWHAGVHAAEVARSLEGAGFRIRSQIIWAKQHYALSRGHYHWQHEPCWYAVRRGAGAHWQGDRRQSTLWQTPNLNPFGGSLEGEEPSGHGTQKPVILMTTPLLNHSVCGDAVYDPFLGSGATLIAAERSGRICMGLDVEPRYVDVAVRRWQQLTGGQARLESDGRSFNEIEQERLAPAGLPLAA